MPNMSRSEANSDKIITEWIIEYARSLMWQQFKTCNSNPTSHDEFIQGVIKKAECIGYCSGESLLTEFLFLIHWGCSLYGNGLGDITPLAKAIKILPDLKKNFRSLKKKELTQVELLLKEQAVMVCIKKREFGLAKRVKDDIWNATTTQTEKEISNRLDLMIQSRSLSGFDASSSFEDLMELVRKLLEDLCDNQLPCPYLIARATEEGNKKVWDEQDQMTRNLAVATQTGIMLTGSLLNAFISKYKLQAEFGVGFVSEDKFKSAVESLRSRKDQILKTVPDFSSTPVAVEAENVSRTPVVIEKAVSSSSLKRKSREQRSSNSHVNKRSSVSANENPQKDSSSSNDSSDDQDNLPEKPYDISLRKRMTRSRKEPLFQDIEPLFKDTERRWSPPKLPNQQVKRKPRARWTADEEKTVYKAVQKYGVSSWADIVKANVLPGRSNVDIKDKWRTMVKAGRDKELKDELKSGLDSSSEEN